MNKIAISDGDRAARLLSALGEQLSAEGNAIELVVIGGSALLALGLTGRATRDVDVVALRAGNRLMSADPLPDFVTAATNRVARDFGLPSRWLNSEPTTALLTGLPDGFEARLVTRTYGPGLTVHFASRFDQIHLKLHAAVDGNDAKHEADLRTLRPNAEELRVAAEWVRGQDTSPLFPSAIARLVDRLSVDDD